jgi:hypothetical protein
MGFEWRPEFEGADFAGEVEQPHQCPFMSPGVCDFQLVSRNVEWRALPSVRRLHFDEPWRPVRRETGNIITGAIPIFLRDPTDFPCQIGST